MMWLPLYLAKQANMSNYDISLVVVCFETGTLLGALITGLVTDLMGARRYPLVLISIVVGAYFTYQLPENQGFLLWSIGKVGFTVGGAS